MKQEFETHAVLKVAKLESFRDVASAILKHLRHGKVNKAWAEFELCHLIQKIAAIETATYIETDQFAEAAKVVAEAQAAITYRPHVRKPEVTKRLRKLAAQAAEAVAMKARIAPIEREATKTA
jgi:hypothetical protein